VARKGQLERQKKAPKFRSRLKHRCLRCGRARAYYQKFRVCRICFRELAHAGEIPGVTKASW